MIDYFLTTFLMIIGVAYHTMSVVSKQRKKFPELEFKSIWSNFFSQEWDSLMVSALGVVLAETVLYTIRLNEVVLPSWIENWGMYLLAVVWGYAGQRLAYKFLATGESILEKKAEQLKQ